MNLAVMSLPPKQALSQCGRQWHQCAGGECTITLGSTVLDITQSSISSTYDTTGGFKYDADTKTLTLRNCTIDTYTKVSSEQLPGIFKYYNVFLDSRNVGR